jgi:hypothetical protein
VVFRFIKQNERFLVWMETAIRAPRVKGLGSYGKLVTLVEVAGEVTLTEARAGRFDVEGHFARACARILHSVHTGQLYRIVYPAKEKA